MSGWGWQYSEPVAISWEYQYLPQTQAKGENLRALNEAGAAGWELCHVGHAHYLMKRQAFRQQQQSASYWAASGQLPA